MRRNEDGIGSRGGFTLVEVLLVVAILVTLAAVVVVSVGGRREEAMKGSARASIGGIASALELFEVDTGKFPASLQALVQNDGSPNWRGPYVRGGLLPADPWGTAFSYTSKGDNTYEIRSAGPDRQMGSGDDITN
jgi:general secretion pathway protein G